VVRRQNRTTSGAADLPYAPAIAKRLKSIPDLRREWASLR
jgi:hypothetical protein